MTPFDRYIAFTNINDHVSAREIDLTTFSDRELDHVYSFIFCGFDAERDRVSIGRRSGVRAKSSVSSADPVFLVVHKFVPLQLMVEM